MQQATTLTRTELSLLLYFEDCMVNNVGKVDVRRMNDDDRAIAQRWNDTDFVSYGRIASEFIRGPELMWCYLNPEAWKLAHAERISRAQRLWENRNWMTTKEKRESA